MSEERISRPRLFMSVAWCFGQRSSCPRAQVGAVAVKDMRIIASGYVGATSGQPHCEDVGCQMENGVCVRTIHAEANVVAYAAKAGVSLNGAHIYTTHEPCLGCAKLLINAGIVKIVYRTPYHHHDGKQLIDSMGLEIVQYEP